MELVLQPVIERGARVVDFDEWVAVRGDALYRLAYVLTGNRADAEDVLQDALSRALPRWSRILEADDPDAYVRRMVVNAHTSWWRSVPTPGVTGRRGAAWGRPASRTSTSTTGSGAPAWRCRADQRVAVVLRYYEHRDYAEIADLTGVREGTVRSRVSRGLASSCRSWTPSGRTTMSDLETRLSEGLAGTAGRAPRPTDLAAGARAGLRRRRRTTTAVVAAALAVVAVPVGVAVVGGEAGRRPDGRDPTTVAERARRLADRDLARPSVERASGVGLRRRRLLVHGRRASNGQAPQVSRPAG